MANVYIEQYRNALRDDAGAVIPVEGALISEGSAVLDASGTGDTLELNEATTYIYVRAAGECYGGFTDTPDNLDDAASFDNDRFDLQDGVARWKAVQGTHFSVILKADA
jgi:hypothetical protein